MRHARPAGGRPTVQNGPVSLLARLTLVCAAVLGGCGWDGPPSAVRVVPEVTVAVGGDVTPGGSRTDTVLDSGGGATESASGGGVVADADAPNPAVEGGADIDIVPPFPATVVVVGDSLTLSARDEITAALDGLGLEVLVVDGVESRRMTVGNSSRPSGLEAIRSIHEELTVEPDLWVIALGTNDVGAQVDEQRFRDDLQATLDGVGPDAPLVWVNLWIRDRRDAVVTANGVIRDEIDGRASPAAVVGWFAHGADDALTTGDGVHLTDRGRDAFATAIANRVRTLYRR